MSFPRDKEVLNIKKIFFSSFCVYVALITKFTHAHCRKVVQPHFRTETPVLCLHLHVYPSILPKMNVHESILYLLFFNLLFFSLSMLRPSFHIKFIFYLQIYLCFHSFPLYDLTIFYQTFFFLLVDT